MPTDTPTLFVSDWKSPAMIGALSTTSGRLRILHEGGGLSWPGGMAIDPQRQLLYVVDSFEHAIFSVCITHALLRPLLPLHHSRMRARCRLCVRCVLACA